jgi:hypothetical protein
MIKISLIINDSVYLNNSIFDKNNRIVNRDDCQIHLINLREKCINLGFELNTCDITSIEICDLAIFFNIPSFQDVNFIYAIQNNIKCYALINELDLIHVRNKRGNEHNFFIKIFTYQNEYIDNIKYFKTNYSFDFKKELNELNIVPYKEKKFAAMIAGNKKLNHKFELYSERLKTIKWFEKNASEFDLFGNGWNLKHNLLIKYFTHNFISYKGKIAEKKHILRNYKFNICYENASNIPGWITEKIFDSFFAGCVPVYWGWEGVSNYIDNSCFIDRCNFKSNKDLYDFLNNIDEYTYNLYLFNIQKFLNDVSDDSSNEFCVEYFTNTIINQIKIDFVNNVE